VALTAFRSKRTDVISRKEGVWKLRIAPVRCFLLFFYCQ